MEGQINFEKGTNPATILATICKTENTQNKNYSKQVLNNFLKCILEFEQFSTYNNIEDFFRDFTSSLNNFAIVIIVKK